MKLNFVATISASASLALATACAAPAAVPADPWHVGVSKDEMTDQRTSSAEASIASEGHAFHLTATCAQFADLAGIGLEILAPHDRFKIVENTTLNGTDLTGYSANTTSRVAVRLRFDSGDLIAAAGDAAYNNAFTLAFFDKGKANVRLNARPTQGGDPMNEMMGLLLAFGAMFGGAADVSQLVAGRS